MQVTGHVGATSASTAVDMQVSALLASNASEIQLLEEVPAVLLG